MIGSLLDDLHRAARSLARWPGFVATAVSVMALGLGLSGGVFSVLDALLLRPPPVSSPQRLAHVYSAAPRGVLSHEPMAFPDYEALRRRMHTLSSLAAHTWCPLALQRAAGSELIMGEIVTGDYFATLGVATRAGRLLRASDDDPRASHPVVVLSHEAWLRYFAGSPDAVGLTVHLNGRPFTVVGITPSGFRGLTPGLAPDVWLPIHATATLPMGVTINLGGRTPGLDRFADRASLWVWVTGRLRPGASMREAETEATLVGSQLAREFPATNRRRSFSLVPAQNVRLLPGLDGALWTASLLVLALFATGMLLAAVNLAALFLSRALSRRRALATSLALGASRARLVRQLLAEGLIVASAGCALGLVLASLSNRWLARVATPAFTAGWPLDLVLAPALDWRVVTFTLATAIVAVAVFALVPALEATRPNLTEILREDVSGTGRGSGRLRAALVATQVAVSVVLLAGTASALRVLADAVRSDPGFEPQGAAVLTLSPGLLGYDAERCELLYKRIRERVADIPGVESVAFASHLPLTSAINWRDVAPSGDGEAVHADWASVGVGYFATMRVPLLAGRACAPTDTPTTRGVVVVNQTLARRLWPGVPAIGRRLRDGAQVIGVVRDGKYRTLGESSRPFVYTCLGQDRRQTRTLIARTEGDPRSILPALRAAAVEVDPRLPTDQPRTLAAATSEALLVPRLAAGLVGSFSLLALLLAGLGIFAVVGHLAATRTREIGLRQALGASRASTLGWLLLRATQPVAAGLAAGLVGAASVNRALVGLVPGLRPVDWPALVAAVCGLALVAFAAALPPGLRAVRCDPASALRHE